MRKYACDNHAAVRQNHTRGDWGNRLVSISSLLAIFVIIAAFILPASRPNTAYAEDGDGAVITPAASSTASTDTSTDFDSWQNVSDSIAKQLNTALKTYTSGDYSTASAQVSSALNITYTASNFISIVHDKLGLERQQQESSQFQSIQQLMYTSGHDTDISAQIDALNQDLANAAAALDADTTVEDPRSYAKTRTEQTQAQRKKLQAEKKTKFTGKGDRTWSDVASDMGKILDEAVKASKQGDGRKGSDKVNEAYYQYYEKLGFEKNVMNAIGGSRVSLVESRFKETRKAMIAGDPIAEITQKVNQLKAMLVEDAQKLDGGAADQVNGFTKFITSSFGQAFVILIREGLEALLVVAAIIAYLVKSDNKKLVKWIYAGVIVGLMASGLMAVLFGLLFSGNGPQQEIMEGVVALIAMVMLIYTSNWMLSKSSVDSWNKYIKDKTQTTVDSVTSAEKLTFGGIVSLAMLSFLAVFREGAETVMFYQSIYSMTQDSSGMWGGGISAAVILVIIFVIFRYTTVKIPIRPFFIVTSVLMALLVVIFAGGGVHALIEGDLLGGIYLSGMPTNDWFGFYPYVETIVAQALALIVMIALYVVFWLKERNNKHTNVKVSDTSQVAETPEDIDAHAESATRINQSTQASRPISQSETPQASGH